MYQETLFFKLVLMMPSNNDLLKLIISVLASLAAILGALINRGEITWIYIIISFIAGILIGSVLVLQKISIKALIPIIIILLASIFAIIIIIIGPPDSSIDIPTIYSLTSDKISPQIAGTMIKMTADARGNDNKTVYYKFSLKGPNTGGKLLAKTDWETTNSWTWSTSELDAGYNTINVKASYTNTNGNYSSKDIDYVIAWANITEPAKPTVNGFPRIEGKSKGILPGVWITKQPSRRPFDKGYQLWIFVYPHDDGYHPQDLDVSIEANGDWSTSAGIGGKSGQKFDLLAVIADENTTKAINRYFEVSNETRYWPGLNGSQIPPGAIVDRRTVVLN